MVISQDDDELIEFLNGFNYANPGNASVDMYVDDEGLPTDPFLEALKSSEQSIKQHLMQKKGILLQNRQQLHQSKSIPLNSLLSESQGNSRKIGTDSDHSCCDSEEYDDDDDDALLENPNNAENYKRFKNRQRRYSGSSERKQSQDDFVLSSSKLPKKKSAKANTKRIKKTKQPATIHIADKPTTKTVSAAVSAWQAEEEQLAREHLFDATEQLEVEAEARVKSLRLRLAGQLNTIRTLETQLAENNELLNARNKQLAHAHARLKALEPAATLATSKGGTQTTAGGKDSGRLRAIEESMDKYKKQADLLQSRLLEEQAKRQRAEEKSRVLKDYAEKSKTRCLSLESMNAESKGALVEMTARTEKYKKAYKELAAEIAAQKQVTSVRDTELTAQRQKTERVESALRNLQMELEHAREELRGVRCEHKVAVASARQLEVQLEIVREKEATKQAEKRLQHLTPQRNGSTNSNRQQSTRQHKPQQSYLRNSGGFHHTAGFSHVQLQPYDYPMTAVDPFDEEETAMFEMNGLKYSGDCSDNNRQIHTSCDVAASRQSSSHTLQHSHEWVRHTVSPFVQLMDPVHSKHVSESERALDREVVLSNKHHSVNLSSTAGDDFTVPRSIYDGDIPSTEDRSAPAPQIINNTNNIINKNSNNTNTVDFIRSRVDNKGSSSSSRQVDDIMQTKPNLHVIPQQTTQQYVPAATATTNTMNAISPASSSSISSNNNNRDDSSRLQRLYARVTARSGSTDNSNSSGR